MFGDQTGNGDPNLHGTCTTITVACVRIITNSVHSYINILSFFVSKELRSVWTEAIGH